MAKKQSRTGENKSAAIRELLASNPEMSPKDIAGTLTARGFAGVTAQYVSTIKSNAKLKGAKPRKKFGSFELVPEGNVSLVTRAILPPVVDSEDLTLTAAFKFIKASGGLAPAMQALGAIEKLFNGS